MRTSLRAALVGALIFLALFGLQIWVMLSFEVMGQSSDSVTQMVFDNYFGALILALGSQALAHAALGAGLALGVTWLAGGRRLGLGWLVLSILAVQAALWARHVHHMPQAHAALLFDAGGWRAALQIWLTDAVPAWALDVPFWVLAGLALIAVIRTRWTLRRVALLAAIGLLIAAWRLPWRAWLGDAPPADRPNILIIANDSARPDHMGTYGYHRPTTPRLDAWAEDAAVFERAYVPIARTFPSWASLLTGEAPHAHGLRHMFPRADSRLQGRPTLPRALAAAGYRTAVVADYAGDIFTKMDAGFERVIAPEFNVPTLLRQRCLQMTPALLPWMENPLGQALFPDLRGLPELPRTGRTIDELAAEIDRQDGRPFFVVGFVSSSHFPFASPAPWYRRFTAPDYEGPSRYLRYQRLDEDAKALVAEQTRIQDLFDGTMGYFDHQFGRLWAHLEARGLAENTIVVFTADHGENLGELGTVGHGDHLRGQWASRVPLIIRGPGITAGRVPGIARSVDLAPTLLRLAGVAPLPIEPSPWSGHDLSPMLHGEADDLGLIGYAETGLWFASGGNQFFAADRLEYPGIVQLSAIRHEADGDIILRPQFEDRVALAKHRAVWSRTGKLIYLPTPDGPRLESWRLDAEGREHRSLFIDPTLMAAMQAFLLAEGRAALVGYYPLPTQPVAQP